MAAMMSVLARLTALEAEVASLREVQPLESFTASLKAASPEQVKAWMEICSEVAGDHMAKGVKPKVAKEKGKVTNETGPAEWNVFVKHVRQTMAASAGIIMDGDGKVAEKEFSDACKEAGITYQAVLKEASRQKAVLEGKEPKEAKVPKVKATDAEVKAKVAAAVAAKVATPAKVAPAAKAVPAEPASSELELQLAAAADMGWVIVEHEGETFFHDPTDPCNLAFSYPDGYEQIGTYMPATAFAKAKLIRNGE